MDCTLRRSGVAGLLALWLAGCATMADMDKAKTTWQGASYDEVVSAWGVPSRQTSLSDGSQVYTWTSERGGGGYPASAGVFGGSGGGGIGVSIPLPGMGGGEHQNCERTLTFKGGRVVNQLWQGHPGFCSTFSR
jgi:hypothetical protein